MKGGEDMDAIWKSDYDMTTDTLYKRPSCPVCAKEYGCVPLYRIDNKRIARCVNCRKDFMIDENMEKWFDDHEGYKEEMVDCMMCETHASFRMHYRKNPVTLKWQEMGGECEVCGCRVLV